MTEILYERSEALIAVVLVGSLALAGELGYRLGRRRRHAPAPREEAQFTSIEGALLALLSLLLGFSFAMALSRFEYRKQMVVQESNAIGTAVLRARFLPQPHRDEVQAMFHRYVDIRLEAVLRTGAASPARHQLDAEARRLHQQLWRAASTAAAEDPASVPLGLMAQAVNDLIDAKAQRDVAVANHVPESVLLLMIGFAIVAAGVLGYGNGLANTRVRMPTTAYAVIVVLVILMIIDLDRPQRGLARVSQESMRQLQTLLDSAVRNDLPREGTGRGAP